MGRVQKNISQKTIAGDSIGRWPCAEPPSNVAPKEESNDYIKYLGSVQKVDATKELQDRGSRADLLTRVLPVGAVLRIDKWRAVLDELWDDDDEKKKKSGLWIDVDNNPGRKGASAGDDWPVILRSCNILYLSEDPEEWYMPSVLEMFGAMGFHMHDATTADYPLSILHSIVSKLKPCQQKQLVGNGMHLVTQSAWMLYVLANVTKLDDPNDVSFLSDARSDVNSQDSETVPTEW